MSAREAWAGGMMTFYLGTCMPSWLPKPEFAGVPLFVSHLRLRGRKALPRAGGRWALDSGGFTCITQHRRYLDAPREYAAAVRRYRDEIGGLEWASTQDWMCEPVALGRTGLTVREHQERTVRSALDLTSADAALPWRYNLQGWALDDYLRCLDLYGRAGIDVHGQTFGLGSVCRRQDTDEAQRIVERLESEGVRLHLYGYKAQGVSKVGSLGNVESCDSMAWSYAGRYEGPCGLSGNANCANCPHYALEFYDTMTHRIRAVAGAPRQLRLFD